MPVAGFAFQVQLFVHNSFGGFMHLDLIPPGSKVRYELDPTHSWYGYVDLVNGIKCFFCTHSIWCVDVTDLFLKRLDGQLDISILPADKFHHIEPSLPFAR